MTKPTTEASMTTRKLVAKVRHHTGSLYRGHPASIDRTQVARAIRAATFNQRFGLGRPTGYEACGTCLEFRAARPEHCDYDDPGYPSQYRIACTRKNLMAHRMCRHQGTTP